MSTLTPEQRALGRRNSETALGFSRRDFLKGAAAAPALGAFYFAYGKMEGKDPVRAVIIGTGDEGCQAMIRDHNRAYVNYIGFCDIRPTQAERCRKEFLNHKDYTPADVDKFIQYPSYEDVIKDDKVEMIVIALPLWLHAPVAIAALKAGKHVFCEKLMARTVAECKDMCQAAKANNRLLAVGHQRHYSTLYDNANFLINQGYLGDVRHIRALWHRSNGQPIYQKKGAALKYNANGAAVWDPKEATEVELDADGRPVIVTGTLERNGIISDGKPLYWDSWSRGVPDADRGVDYAKHGYNALHELIAWRLYDRTGAGLMAELGSHQLDACSIFLGKKHPLAVLGTGGLLHYRDNRQVDDHVFVQFEFPGNTDKTDDRVVVTYSSICTNGFEDYGETVMGTRGTMMVLKEEEILLYQEPDRNGKPSAPKTTAITVGTAPPAADASASWGGAGAAAASSLGGASGKPSRGYREELEHFAYCIRHGKPDDFHGDKEHQPRCSGKVALADAVIALTSNLAMKKRTRIEFSEKWFDANDPATPDESTMVEKIVNA